MQAIFKKFKIQFFLSQYVLFKQNKTKEARWHSKHYTTTLVITLSKVTIK